MTRINIDFENLHEARELTKHLRKKIIPKAAKQAMRRAERAAKSEIGKIAREERRGIKKFQIKQRLQVPVKNLKGNDLDRYLIILKITRRSFPLIQFVLGAKKPRKQKGIPVNRRSRLKVRIRKRSPRDTRPKMFIARAPGRNHNLAHFDVFNRETKDSNPLDRQIVPSLAHLFYSHKKFEKRVKKRAGHTLQKQFKASVTFELSKLGA